MDSQNQGKDMCSNKIEFLALKEKAAWKFEFVKLMHIWEDLGEYLVEIFVGNCPHMGYHPYTLVIPP